MAGVWKIADLVLAVFERHADRRFTADGIASELELEGHPLSKRNLGTIRTKILHLNESGRVIRVARGEYMLNTQPNRG